MNRAVYCINCEYSESRGISPEQTEKGDGQKENNRKGSPEQKEIRPHEKVGHTDDKKNNEQRRKRTERETWRKGENEWTERVSSLYRCPSS